MSKTKQVKMLSADEILLSKEIAHRLKSLRLSFLTEDKKPLSRDKLSEMIERKYAEDGFKLSRFSIMNYEIDDPDHKDFGSNLGMSAKVICYLSDFFGVSADYIVGRRAEKTPDNSLAGAAAFTGLSETAMDNLRRAAYFHGTTLNKLFENYDFMMLSLNLRILEGNNQELLEDITEAREQKYQTDLGSIYEKLRYLKLNLYETCERFRELICESLQINNTNDIEKELADIIWNSEEG